MLMQLRSTTVEKTSNFGLRVGFVARGANRSVACPSRNRGWLSSLEFGVPGRRENNREIRGMVMF